MKENPCRGQHLASAIRNEPPAAPFTDHCSLATAPWPLATGLSVLLPAILCGFFFFHGLGERDLWSSHEARAGQNAQSILETGDWVLPHQFDGKPELQKPPLYYWLVAVIVSWGQGSVDTWAVRLPAAVAGMAGVLGLHAFLVWRGRPVAGLVAGLVLATAQHYTWLARVGRIDMPLTLAIGVALGCFYLGVERVRSGTGKRSWRAFLPAYLALAAAAMLKGPIGILLPAAVGIGWRVAGGGWRVAGAGNLFTLHPPPSTRLGMGWGVPLVLALVLPWYIWASCRTEGEFLRVFFWHHHIERGLSGAEAGLNPRPWYFYGPQLLFDFLPWSPLLLAAGWFLIRSRRWQDDPEARFGSIWLLSMVLVLSCFRFKRADYLLPAYPAAAMVVGCACETWLRQQSAGRWLKAGLAVMVLACVGFWAYLIGWDLPREESRREHRRFAEAIRTRAPRPFPIVFFRTEAHPLAFHLGGPLYRFAEWENLDNWAQYPGCLVVMPPDAAEDWPLHLTRGRLVEVMRNSDLTAVPHEQPLVLMRTIP